MKCQKCNDKKATVYFSEVVNNKKHEIALCVECAKEHNPKMTHVLNEFDSQDNMVKIKVITESNVVENMLDQLDDPTRIACPDCDLTLQDFVAKGKVGCSKDYEYFAEELKPIIERLQGGNSQHTGKFPTKADVKKRIETLEAEMQSAVKVENYERAAQIRDKLKELQEN